MRRVALLLAVAAVLSVDLAASTTRPVPVADGFVPIISVNQDPPGLYKASNVVPPFIHGTITFSREAPWRTATDPAIGGMVLIPYDASQANRSEGVKTVVWAPNDLDRNLPDTSVANARKRPLPTDDPIDDPNTKEKQYRWSYPVANIQAGDYTAVFYATNDETHQYRRDRYFLKVHVP